MRQQNSQGGKSLHDLPTSIRRCFASAKLVGIADGLPTGIRVVLTTVVGTGLGRSGILYQVKLLVRDGIADQLTGTDLPGLFILVVLSVGNFLQGLAILGDLIDEAVGICGDVQSTGTVGAGLSSPGDEVDVGFRVVGRDLTVVVKGEGEVRADWPRASTRTRCPLHCRSRG